MFLLKHALCPRVIGFTTTYRACQTMVLPWSYSLVFRYHFLPRQYIFNCSTFCQHTRHNIITGLMSDLTNIHTLVMGDISVWEWLFGKALFAAVFHFWWIFCHPPHATSPVADANILSLKIPQKAKSSWLESYDREPHFTDLLLLVHFPHHLANDTPEGHNVV